MYEYLPVWSSMFIWLYMCQCLELYVVVGVFFVNHDQSNINLSLTVFHERFLLLKRLEESRHIASHHITSLQKELPVPLNANFSIKHKDFISKYVVTCDVMYKLGVNVICIFSGGAMRFHICCRMSLSAVLKWWHVMSCVVKCFPSALIMCFFFLSV